MKVILLGIFFLNFANLADTPDCDKLQLSFTITHTKDGKDNGEISVKITNGEAPYKYYLFGNGKDNNKVKVNEKQLKDLKSGEYLLVVQDNSMCRVSEKIVIK